MIKSKKIPNQRFSFETISYKENQNEIKTKNLDIKKIVTTIRYNGKYIPSSKLFYWFVS